MHKSKGKRRFFGRCVCTLLDPQTPQCLNTNRVYKFNDIFQVNIIWTSIQFSFNHIECNTENFAMHISINQLNQMKLCRLQSDVVTTWTIGFQRIHQRKVVPRISLFPMETNETFMWHVISFTHECVYYAGRIVKWWSVVTVTSDKFISQR